MVRRSPPSPDRLMRSATAYLARRAASAARMREVLARAIARQTPADAEPDQVGATVMIDAVVERLQRAGLLDDAEFGRLKAASLARKGKPAGAIRAELKHRHGIEAGEGEPLANQLDALDPLAQATRWAERRRLGPFRLRDRVERRERDIASLARAGFAVSVARAVIDGDGRVPD